MMPVVLMNINNGKHSQDYNIIHFVTITGLYT